MNSKMLYPVIFLSGAIAGVMVSWPVAKKKYERIAQEEIDSVKAMYRKKEAHAADILATIDDKQKEKAEVKRAYSDLVTDNRYSDREEEHTTSGRYVIPPEEFGDDADYECISLIFYKDGVVADENDEALDDVETSIGTESLDHFGEYEDDSVYVKNDILKCYYEILLSNREYSDVLKEKPYLRRRANDN